PHPHCLGVVSERTATRAVSGLCLHDALPISVSNPATKVPRAIANDPNDNDRISDRYIEDGSYLRIRNIALGYTLPADRVQRWKLDRKSTRLNSSHVKMSYAVFCFRKTKTRMK